MFRVVVAPNAFTVVAVVLKRAKVDDPVTTDVVNDGEVAASNNATPVPFSSVRADRRLALDGVPNHVCTPEPSVWIDSVTTFEEFDQIGTPLAAAPGSATW